MVVVAMFVVVRIAVIVVVFVFTVMVAVVVVFLVFAVVIAVIVVAVLLIAMPVLIPTGVASPVGMFSVHGIRAVIYMARIVIGINVSVKATWTTEPRPGADENASCEPLRPVIAERRALVGRVIEIAVRTDGRHSNVDADLGGCSGIGASQANNSKNWHGDKAGQFHYLPPCG